MSRVKEESVIDNVLFLVERDAAERLATDAFRGRTGDLQSIYREHVQSCARTWGVKNKIAPADILNILGVTDAVH
jgi:hypothetical protein